MKQTIEVEMDDGVTYLIHADARDIRAWEAEHEKSWFREPLSFTTVTQVAFLAGRRTGVLNGQWSDYETFDKHCINAEGRRESSTIGNPTQKAPTEGSSASSRTNSTASPRRSNKRVQK